MSPRRSPPRYRAWPPKKSSSRSPRRWSAALLARPGLVSMRSSSTFGLSLITLVFKDGAEDYWSRQRITERLSQVSLPPGVTPGLDPVSGPAGEIYRYTLESNSKNLMQLSELQTWVIDTRTGEGSRCGQCRHLWRLHQRVPAGAGSSPAAALRRQRESGQQRDLGQYLQRRRQSHHARRAVVHRAWHRHGAYARRSSATSWSPRAMACRCSCATWANCGTAIRCDRAFLARTTIPTPSRASSTC